MRSPTVAVTWSTARVVSSTDPVAACNTTIADEATVYTRRFAPKAKSRTREG